MDQQVLNAMQTGFIKQCGIQLVTLSKQSTIVKAEIKDEYKNPFGIVHGGFIFTLADTVTGLAATADGRLAVTINAHIDFLKSTKSGYLTAQSNLVKDGNKISVFSCQIKDDNENTVASAQVTYYYL